MDRLAGNLIKHKKSILILFCVLTVISVVCSQLVDINYNILDYLPDDAPSTTAINVMQDEYSQGVPNVRLMLPEVSITQARAVKEKLLAIDGVEEVTWLDDVASLEVPLETLDQDIVEDYYKDGNALLSITVDEEKANAAIHQIREIAGENASLSGMQVNITFASETIGTDLQKIMAIAIPIILVILLLTTTSWFEPVIFLITIGVAILINMGTNIFFGEISFITKGVAAILQLAVSMDYAIFILHRFSEFRAQNMPVDEAMKNAVKKSFSSVSASGVTTIIGFISLVLMRIKLGPDVGWVMTKGIIISLISVFTFLPAITMLCYKLIDKTQHRPLIPKMNNLAKATAKICIPALIVSVIVLVPSIPAVGNNNYVYFDIFTDQRTSLGQQATAIKEEFGDENALVLMVEKGDLAKEKQVVEEIKQIPNVSSVVAYVETVGAEIPEEYVPENQLSKLISDHYSRIVITLDTSMESEDTFAAVRQLRQIGQNYYPDNNYLAGEAASTFDMKDIIEQDNTTINLIAAAAIFVILLLTFRSISIPVILVVTIEAAIWINEAIPYFAGNTMFYIAYLVIGALQLGATVDYAILFTNRYFENREIMLKKEAMKETVCTAAVSILTSGSILFVAGIVLSQISSNSLLSEIGTLVGRGALLSLFTVLFVLPALLTLFDKVIQKTTMRLNFKNRLKGETK